MANKKVKRTATIFSEHVEADWDTGQCPKMAVDSTDRRNTLCELLSWRLILQGLAWPFVQLSGNGAQFLGRNLSSLQADKRQLWAQSGPSHLA